MNSRVLRIAALGLAVCGLLWANHVKFLDWHRRLDSVEEQPLLGSQAPDFTLQDVSGTPVTLSGLRGQPVVLEFWASWCAPCRRQFRSLASVDRRLRSGIRFLALNVKEEPAVVRSFVAHENIPADVLLDVQGKVANLYKVTRFPTTLFIGREGRVLLQHSGQILDVEDFLRAGSRKAAEEAKP